MGIFDFLPRGSASAPENIPTFKQGAGRDPTDLHVKAMLYLFKRLRVNRLASFSSGETLKYTDNKSWGQSGNSQDEEIAKLDMLFNFRGFQKLLVEEEQRVLIDWPKNKFRAFCFLSEIPTSARSCSSSPVRGTSMSQPDESSLPSFEDYKDRPVSSYAFTVLPVNTSIFIRDLGLILAQSLLYSEHHSYISFTSRIQTAEKAIAKFCENGSTMVELSEDKKASIVNEYLKQLAFLVQLMRIYQQCVKQKDVGTPVGSPKKVTLANPPQILRSTSSLSHLSNGTKSSPRPTLSPKKSIANLGSSSPKRSSGESSGDISPRKQLSARPSISNFRANEIYNPVTSPPISSAHSDGKFAGSGALSNHSSEMGRENNEVLEKCRRSIREKLANERESIAKQRLPN